MDTTIVEMSNLSADSFTRWFKKSASEQYLYAKALPSEHRDALERSLEARMREASDSTEARALMTMWLSVQQARIRTHDRAGLREYRREAFVNAGLAAAMLAPIPLIPTIVAEARRGYYSSPSRPEYEAAFDNFMRLIGDETLNDELRQQAAGRLEYHLRREGTIAPRHAALLERYGSPHALAAAGFRTAMTTEFERAWSARRAGMRLQADLARQVRPLSEEIRSWLLLSNDLPGSDRIHPGDELTEFDTEDCAPAFARVLARMQLEMATSGTASHQRRAATLWEGSQMIRAISEDARLRQSVFHLAIAALGDCGDAVVDGFSAMVSEVRRHQIVDGIRKGRMDLQQLDDWMRREFRLQKLEEAVEQFIEAKLTQPHLRADIRRNLTIEPLESMLHAKVALRDRLALPDHTPSGMANRSSSVLTESDLQDLVKRVREQESNQEELLNFMLAKQSWRDGVKELYKQEFETLEAEFEEDPFHDLPLPPIDDTHVAEMTKYNEAAAEYAKRKDNAEKAILSRIVQDWPENRGSPESILLARQLIEPFLGAGTVSSSSSPDRLCDLPETSHRSTDYNAPSTAAR